MGTGPWKFVARSQGDFIEFERFNDHWRGAPKFARLKMVLVPEQSTRLALLQSREADIVDISPERVDEAEKSGFKIAENPLFSTVRVNLWATYYPEAGPAGNVQVREALNLAINRDEMIKTLFNGRGEPAAVTLGPHTMGYPKDLKPYPYDPARARQLLTSAGYANGFEIKIYSYGAGPFTQFKEVSEAVAGYWGAIGVKVTIIPTDLTTMRPRYFGDREQDPSIVGQAGVIGLPTGTDGVSDLNIWWTQSGKNMKLAPNVDDITSRAERATSIEQLSAGVTEAFTVLHSDYRNVPIAHIKGFFWAYGNQMGSVQVLPYLSQALSATLWTAEPTR
jgi:ABC-type transport system substrate-binding protein